MKAIAQDEIISLISDLNMFADRAERIIDSSRSELENYKRQLLNQHAARLETLDSTYKQSRNNIMSKSNKTISDARNILSEINKLDSKLVSVDKYYVKTKKKKEAELAQTTSDKYINATDYFDAMSKIKADYNVIYKKYSEDILPALINGINYIFSSKRKSEYEELIVLRNTVASFVSEIEKELPILTKERLEEVNSQFAKQREEEVYKQNSELMNYEKTYNNTLDDAADRVCSDLEAILPDEFVAYLHLIKERYGEDVSRVNTSSIIRDDILDMIYLNYQIDYLVQSRLVSSVIKDKCSSMIGEDGNIIFPFIFSTTDAPPMLIRCDGNNATAVQEFMHSVMYGFLSSCPVSHLSFIVVDPENRGNSIYPFFDAKKKLPDLFGDKIIINKEDVLSELIRINEKIDNIIQDKLGNQYDDIYSYAEDHDEYIVNTEQLTVFDFPKGFDARSLGELRNVLRNGSKCGINVVIDYIPGYVENNNSKEYQDGLQSILDLSVVFDQRDSDFSYKGLPVDFYRMPEKKEFANFFSKYMLIYEGIKNRGIAFSPLIKKLVDARDSSEIQEHISHIKSMLENYDLTYAHVPDIDAKFPDSITLGSVVYPADIFSDSIGYDEIVAAFGLDCKTDESYSCVELPLSFDLRNSFNLFLQCSENSRNAINIFTHHVIWSFFSFLPITKFNVCVFDNEQRGNSIIPFLDFRKKVSDAFSEQIYTSSESMISKLQAINSQIDEFIQNKLGNRFKDLLDYNLNSPNRAEPITLLLIYDFPSGVDGRGFDLLTNILRNGNKCGVYTVICHNSDFISKPYEKLDDRIEQIQKYCSLIEFREGKYGLQPFNLQINIPSELSLSEVETFADEYCIKSEQIKQQGLSFKDIISKDLFSFDSSESLKIPIGIGDGDNIVNITIGTGSSHHVLIAGATGSGKSTLLHTLIMSAMLHYSPDELHLYLMDFKSGTEFKVYESVRLPHIQLLALDAMQEFGESILENLVDEMTRRSDLFKDAGQSKLKGYKEATGNQLPRILVIMDEFQILFNSSTNRKVAMHCDELAKRIVTEGRAYGIHLLMATQSTKVITSLELSSGTIEQMRIRIGLKCSEYDARYLFSDLNERKALAMMKGPQGTAVMNLDYSELSNIGLRVAFCDDKTKKEYLDLISEHFSDKPYNLRIFEGSRNTDLLDHFDKAGIGPTNDLSVTIHMGSLIKVAPPFSLVLDKKRKHNLLICGSNVQMASRVFNNYLISALMNQHVTVYCIDGDLMIGDSSSRDFYKLLSDEYTRFHIADNRSDIIKYIRDVFNMYQARKKQNGDDIVVVAVKNLQFLDIVISMLKGERIDESEFEEESTTELTGSPADILNSVVNSFSRSRSDDNLSVGEKLTRLITDGSGFGIHFVVSSLEYQTIRESMYYGEQTLTRFPERIIFSLGDADASRLIENVSVMGLPNNTVMYTDGVKNSYQLKPYITPAAEELKSFYKSKINS